jgi:NAD(P) transhydrogenase subunit beta
MYGIVRTVASACFIFALIDECPRPPGMACRPASPTVLAVLATWADPSIVHHAWIVLAIVAGFVVGVPLSRVPLTAVPQRTALSHAFGGVAAGLVGTAEYYLKIAEAPGDLTTFRMVALIAEVILGYLTFAGSLMAAGKLQ